MQKKQHVPTGLPFCIPPLVVGLDFLLLKLGLSFPSTNHVLKSDHCHFSTRCGVLLHCRNRVRACGWVHAGSHPPTPFISPIMYILYREPLSMSIAKKEKKKSPRCMFMSHCSETSGCEDGVISPEVKMSKKVVYNCKAKSEQYRQEKKNPRRFPRPRWKAAR